MAEQNQNKVYVDMMMDTLKRKKRVLTDLLEKTREQETLLKDEEMNPEDFQKCMNEKGEGIEELNRIDEGFDRLFHYVETEIKANRMQYKEQIMQMQRLIGEVSELGLQIQALEYQNKGHFEVYLAKKRKTIRDFHTNQKTATSYYKNLANAHKPDQSYFFNETK